MPARKDRSMKSSNPDWSNQEQNDLLAAEAAQSAQESASGATADEINQKVQQAQTQLLELKRQQDEIERQKRELEELSRKQREFEEGRRDILEKLTRGLVVLERQEFEVKREAEQIQLIRETFGEHLKEVEQIKPQEWDAGELQAELTRALAIIDQAHAVHAQAKARLESLREEPEAGEAGDEESSLYGTKSFGLLLREGFAYTLPLIVVILFTLFILLYSRHA
jgi:hypothetical protein